MPTEDLEDLNLIKSKYENIEEFDFKEIISKYSLEDSIIALIFKTNKDLRILSKINIQKNVVLKNQTFLDIDINNNTQISEIIPKLKTIYEDYWKTTNEINTSIKLPLTIKVDNNNNLKRELNINNNYFIYTVLGTLDERKGHKFLLEIFKNLIKTYKNSHLLICGDGSEEEREKLFSIIKTLDIKKHNLSFLGYVDEINFYAMAIESVT